MSIKAKLCSLSMTAAVFSFIAPGSWAADTVCTTKTVGLGTDTTRIAVASNFYGPAQDLVDAFQLTTAGADTTITICHNSTTHLMAEISDGTGLPSSAFPTDPGYPRYGMFFAANTSAATYGTSAFTYAKGIPVFYGLRPNFSSVSNLITGLGGGTSYAITDTCNNTGLAPYAVNTGGAQTLAIASAAAPYGVAAHTILNAITSDEGNNATSLPNTIPSWVHSPLYSNIDLTYTAVNNGTLKSGFVSKAQLCEQIKGNTTPAVTYVEFTGTDCTLDQKAILLNSSDTVSSALNSYIQGRITAGTWNTPFLSDHCYGSI